MAGKHGEFFMMWSKTKKRPELVRPCPSGSREHGWEGKMLPTFILSTKYKKIFSKKDEKKTKVPLNTSALERALVRLTLNKMLQVLISTSLVFENVGI